MEAARRSYETDCISVEKSLRSTLIACELAE
jgi:hypothetical protein